VKTLYTSGKGFMKSGGYILWVRLKLLLFFEWGILAGGDECWDFHETNFGAGRNLLFGLLCKRG
jgi:hypothetical protein